MVKRSLCLAILAGLLASVAQAQSEYFTQSGGNWAAASNWSTGALPGSSTTVYVGGPGTYTCNVTANASASSLYVGVTSSQIPALYGPGVVKVTGGTLNDLLLQTEHGTLLITNGARFGVLDQCENMPGGVIHVDGAGSQFNSSTSVSELGGAAVCVSGGGTLTLPSGSSGQVGGTLGAVVQADVGSGSSITAGDVAASYVRVVCGASPAAGSTYTPITAGTWGGGTYQGVGGVWATTSSGTGTHVFTASNVVTGALASPTSIDTSVDQRVLWTDAKGNTLGASVLAATSSNTITPTVTALPGTTAPPLANGQFLEGDWGLSGVTASPTNPVYLSLSAAPWAGSTTLWCSANGGGAWTQVTAGLVPNTTGGTNATTAGYDLTFNGTYYGFSLTAPPATATTAWALTATTTPWCPLRFPATPTWTARSTSTT